MFENPSISLLFLKDTSAWCGILDKHLFSQHINSCPCSWSCVVDEKSDVCLVGHCFYVTCLFFFVSFRDFFFVFVHLCNLSIEPSVLHIIAA